MTDRINALTIILDHDIRDDDIEPLIKAIRHFRGVLKVKKHVANLDVEIAEERARYDLRKKLFDVLAGKSLESTE